MSAAAGMRTIAVVAAASVREHSRRKLVLFFIGGSVVITAVLLYLVSDISAEALLGSGRGIAFGASIRFLQLFALFAALAVSMGNIGQPFSTGEAIPVLARPVTRWQYAIGRFTASVVVVLALSLLLAIETSLLQLVAETPGGYAHLWGHWATNGFNLVVVAAITTLISVGVATPVLAAVAGFFANQVVAAIGGFYRITQVNDVGGTVGRAVEILWYTTPKFLTSPLRSQRFQAAGQQQASQFIVENTPGLVAWAVAYLVAIVAVTVFFTSRKEV